MYNKGRTERPSDSRRAYLREAHHLQKPLVDRQHIVLSNFCQIDRYYDTADKVLNAFLTSFERNDLDDAYVLGKRFTSFSTDTLPTHSYYKSSQDKLRLLRNDNIKKVGLVTDALEDITRLMDDEELMKAKREIKRREGSAKEKIFRRRKMMEQHRQEKQHQHQQHDDNTNTNNSDNSNLLSLEDKLNRWNLEFPKAAPSLEETESSAADGINNKNNNINIALPPPSYDQAISSNISSITPRPPPPPIALEEQLPLYPFVTPPPLSTTTSSLILPEPPTNTTGATPSISISNNENNSISSLQIETKQTYQKLLSSRQIQIFPLSTHQGRNQSSTNGCTVIAPLIAIRHLSSSSNPTLPDIVIEQVIDKYAPPVLSKVRQKLGLQGDALIIPSDVHDYFIDDKLLSQDQFIGVAGGNILERNHLHSLFDLLRESSSSNSNSNNNSISTKLAATLYFHEHVITILKVCITSLSNNNKQQQEIWYDIIDSMPSPDAATRTRCKNQSALEIALKQYAFKKFHKNDWDHIRTHSWQENMCDIDPRVFQAFVWTATRAITMS